MDRLHVVIGLLIAAVGIGCDRGGESAEAQESSKSRVNAVKAKEEEAPPPEAFCDKYRKPAEASEFEFPELRGDPPAPADGWRWVNVWATWCKPCIEELPRLVEWKDELADKGLADLVLISFDKKQEKVEKFREEHPETPETLLVTDPDKVAKPWFKALGLAEGAPLPIHIFVDPEGRVRCLRAGGVGEDDYDAVERLLGT